MDDSSPRPGAARWHLPTPVLNVFFKVLRIVRRVIKAIALFLLLYVAYLLIGLIPVNNNFQSIDSAESGITIHIVSNDVHADFLLPLQSSVIDWTQQFPSECFDGDTSHATHLAVGWGDKGFYLETPTWAELQASVALKAMFLPSDTCLHVSKTSPSSYANAAKRTVTIDVATYERLVQYVQQSFRRDAQGQLIPIDFRYGKNDAFYEARGIYHCFNTCNSWVGRGMKRIGLRVPLSAPLPRTVLWYLPQDAESTAP